MKKMILVLCLVILILVSGGNKKNVSAEVISGDGIPINGYSYLTSLKGEDSWDGIWPFWTRETDYYTFYSYDKLGIKFHDLGKSYFTTSNTVSGSFERRFLYSSSFSMTTTIPFAMVANGSASLRFEYREELDYELLIGDSATFNTSTYLYGAGPYHNVGVFSINVRILERRLTCYIKYNPFIGNHEYCDTEYVETERDFTIDYEMAPIYESSFMTLYYEACDFNFITETTVCPYSTRSYKGDYYMFLPFTYRQYYFTI